MLRPIDRDFRPDDDAHAVGSAGHTLIVRVMRQPDIVAAKLPRPSKQRRHVLIVVGSSTAIGSLGMD